MTDGFETYYASTIEPVLAEKESERREAVRGFFTSLAVGGAIAAVLFLGVTAMGGGGMGLVVATGVVVIITVGVANVMLSGVRKDTKAILMGALAPYAEVTFNPRVGDPPALEQFKKRKLLPSYDRSSFEDLIEGERAGRPFQLYEAHLEQEHRDKDGHTRHSTVFRGQLVRILAPQRFQGVTVIRRDAGVFNALRNPGDGLKRVGLVDIEFEKIFEVWSNDQVEARYLLTPTFMERLLALESQLNGKKARAAFADGDLIVAVEGGDLFEAGSMFEPLTNPARARRVLGDLDSVRAMVDALVADKPSE